MFAAGRVSFRGCKFEVALRVFLNAFELRNWLEPTKINECIRLFGSLYCAENAELGAPAGNAATGENSPGRVCH